jgi:hypothetical protein
MLEKVRKVGLYYFIGKKSSESWTLSFLLAEKARVQISKLFPNISELFIRNSELYSESPAVFTDGRQKRQPNHNTTTYYVY